MSSTKSLRKDKTKKKAATHKKSKPKLGTQTSELGSIDGMEGGGTGFETLEMGGTGWQGTPVPELVRVESVEAEDEPPCENGSRLRGR
jgi:hypothetical protein